MRKLALKREKELKREDEARIRIPYISHLTRHTILLDNNSYCQVIRCNGVSFESADDSDINAWHFTLNKSIQNIHDPRVSIWHTVIRREENLYPDGNYTDGFAKDFNEKYAAKISKELLMLNEIYITIIFQPQTSSTGKTLSKLFKMADTKAGKEDTAESLEYVDKIANDLMAGLDRYSPEQIGIYKKDGIYFSASEEFLGYLINGECQRIPINRTRIADVLTTTRPFFGAETIELRTPTETIYSAALGIKNYPSETFPGMLNALLSASFSFVLTQSFSFLTKSAATSIVKTQGSQLTSADDDAKSQIKELSDLLDDLASNRIVMGNHHLSLFLKAKSMKRLGSIIASARTAMSDVGMMMAREDLAVEAAFWAQLPGNFKYRPRVAPITSKNFAALASNHNFPSGKKSGNHWGEAATTLVTEADTPYYFSLHASDPLEEDGGHRKDVGDTLLLGPKGSGKTVVVTAMNAFMQKFGITSVFFTKDRDSEIYIRSINGIYLSLKSGIPTGCNFFQLDPTPVNIKFWNEQCRALIRRPLSVKEENELADAISWVASHETPYRRISRLLEVLSSTGDDNLYSHIEQWCYAKSEDKENGIYAHVFDNPEDKIIPFLSGEYKTVGFDITDFLDDSVLRGPLLNYLWFLTKKLVDGRRMCVSISEFWKPLDDPRFAKEVKDALKTWRKKEAFMILDSQSPSDVLNHPEARTLIEQTSTKILFPNDEADQNEYMKGLNLSKREFMLIKQELTPGSRKFMIKQSKNTVIAKLDLKGFDFELDILSGREKNIRLVEEIIEEHGSDPALWMPIFKEKRRTT